MATVREWIDGARPRTLGAAIGPVAAGTGVAATEGGVVVSRALLALGVALALQVGANYANDYSDGVRGTDIERVGPVRLVGQGLAPAPVVRTAAFASFGIAAVLGLALVAISGTWWLLLVGAVAIAAAWWYTGGKRPYGYRGLGEVSVFVFFGIVPVIGTAYVQTLTWSPTALIAAIGVGAIACAVLVANNLRDIPTDSAHDKITLAVRLGAKRTRVLYLLLIALPYVVVVILATGWGSGLGGAWWALISLPLAVRAGFVVIEGATGRDLIPVLALTGALSAVYGILLGLGLAVSTGG
jgi:1,4-dihydroxy-2-naphthoate polyprenyltransferase